MEIVLATKVTVVKTLEFQHAGYRFDPHFNYFGVDTNIYLVNNLCSDISSLELYCTEIFVLQIKKRKLY